MDVLRREDLLLSERALHCVNVMLGLNARELTEESEDEPGRARIEALREKLLAERMEVYRGDRNAQTRCIDAYSPVIRDRRGDRTSPAP
jgi:hypothetical protein